MKLPISLLERKNKPELFLALDLRDEKVTSIIFEKVGNSIKYISHAISYFVTSIEEAQTEEFLNILDKAITQAESALPQNIETHKTLFGLKENWVEDNKIKKEYLDRLKKASEELSLDPIGFLVSIESIISLIQKEEGAPVTAILADIGNKIITLSLVKSGRIVETRSAEIHESPAYTVDTLLKHIKSPEALPSRIIILNLADEKIQHEFTTYLWSKSLSFLHLPRILTMPKDSNEKAMLLGAATQMGTDLIYDSTVTLNPVPQTPQSTADEPVSHPQENINHEISEGKPIDGGESLEYFGFVKNADVAKAKIPTPEADLSQVPDEALKEVIVEIPQEEKVEEEAKNPTPVNAALVTTKIKNFLGVAMGTLSKIKVNEVVSRIGNINNKKMLIIPGLILVLLVLGFYIFTSKTKATVNITVFPKVEEKTAAVTFSDSNDIPNAIIASETITVSEEGSVTAKATGKKDTGTKSKGKVTIFNNSDSTANFQSGTKITSSNNLVFSLDSNVNVASASGDIFSGTNPGTASVNVTASVLGQEYNLPSGTKFAIGSSSDIAAKNDDAFSGGTKKTVTIVSKEDQDKLLTSLPKQLEEKAKNDLNGKVGDGRSVLSTFVNKTVTSKTFDKKIEDEASQFTLKGKVDFQAVAYQNSDIAELASSIFSISKDQLGKENITVEVKNIGIEDDNDVNADLVIKAGILPKIDKTSIAKQIASNPIQKAKNMLSNLTQVKSVEIILQPNIPFLPKNLPADVNKIIINVISS